MLFKQQKQFYPPTLPGVPKNLSSLVARIDYNYKDRYLLEVNMGYNGSANFAKGRRFGFFPSISGGWIVTNQPFMRNIHFINYLKLTASYGLVGNDQGVGRFLYLPTKWNTNGVNTGGYNFGYNTPQNVPAASQQRLGNPLVHWETAKKQNYSIEMKFLASRLQLHFGYFFQHRYDILTTLHTVPVYVAAKLPAVNEGEVNKHGFEASLKWRQSIGTNFSYNIDAHVTFARNKIVQEDEVKRPEPYLQRTGHPVGQIFGYIFAGFFNLSDFNPKGKNPKYSKGDYVNADFVPNSGYPKYPYQPMPGDFKYKDLNGDGVINAQDQRAIGYPSIPEYTFGLTLGFHFRNFEVSTLWTGAADVSRNLSLEPFRTGFGPGGQGWWSLLKWQANGAWTPQKVKEGEKITYPRLSTTIGQRRNRRNSNFWLINGSYIRLKNAEIAYNLPAKFLSNLGIQHFKIYMRGYDLLTFSHLKKYSLDPESKNGNARLTQYPIMQTYSFGIHIEF